ncbi:MAG: hypothetical protein AB1489_05595, partial [Acidobacteriota bacterium]
MHWTKYRSYLLLLPLILALGILLFINVERLSHRQIKWQGITKIATAIGKRRPLEARLTGGFAYGLYHHSSTFQPVRTQLSSGEAATFDSGVADILLDAPKNSSPEMVGATAIVDLLSGEIDKSITDLETILATGPPNISLL